MTLLNDHTIKNVHSVVSPNLYDGNHEEPNINRRFSLLPLLSKECERVALNQIMPYLLSNKKLSTRQNGNKKIENYGHLLNTNN